ncbi:hypothetical protein K2X85_14505 [bacterium]|nr:hypothetical protein [bacterium]
MNAKSGIVFVLLLTNVIHGAVRVDEVYDMKANLVDVVLFEQSDLYRALLSRPTMSGDTRRLLLPIQTLVSGSDLGDFRSSMVFDRTLGRALTIEAPLDDGTMAPASILDLLSRDGRVVVGRNANGSLFRWVDGVGAELIRDSQGELLKATGTGISRDGSVVLANTLSGIQWSQGYAWRAADGVATPLTVTTTLSDGTLADQPVSALGVSGNGQVIAVGRSSLTQQYFWSEIQVQPGVWYLETTNNIRWNTEVNLSYDGSVVSYTVMDESNLLSDRYWRALRGSIRDISNDADLAVGSIGSPVLSAGGFGSQLTYIARADRNWSLDNTLSTDLAFMDIISSVSDNERSFLTLTERVVPQAGTGLGLRYRFAVVTIPEVPGGVMVGMGLMGAVIIARWRRAANRSR